MKTPFLFLLIFPVSGVQALRVGDAVSFYGSRFRIVQTKSNAARYRLSCGLSGLQVIDEKGRSGLLTISGMEILVADEAIRMNASGGKPFPAHLLFRAINVCKKGEQVRLENICVCDRNGKQQPYLVEPLTLEKI